MSQTGNHELKEGEDNARVEEEEEEEEEEEDGSVEANGDLASASKASRPRISPLINGLAFPLSRVTRIIKADGDVRCTAEAVYTISKVVGLFLDKLVEEAFDLMVDESKSSLTYRELSIPLSKSKRYSFLADFVPEKIPASVALSRMAQNDT